MFGREACLALRLLHCKRGEPALLSNWRRFIRPDGGCASMHMPLVDDTPPARPGAGMRWHACALLGVPGGGGGVCNLPCRHAPPTGHSS